MIYDASQIVLIVVGVLLAVFIIAVCMVMRFKPTPCSMCKKKFKRKDLKLKVEQVKSTSGDGNTSQGQNPTRKVLYCCKQCFVPDSCCSK